MPSNRYSHMRYMDEAGKNERGEEPGGKGQTFTVHQVFVKVLATVSTYLIILIIKSKYIYIYTHVYIYKASVYIYTI